MAENITPIRQQYLQIKRRYPQAIVLFRLGDFYETFDEDARIASKELDIVLTSREMGKGNAIPLAGIPYHALDSYLAKLINRGYKVAICEQMTKPGETKGLVQREVVRLVTPGTVVETSLLQSAANNYLVSLVVEEEGVGLAYVDITTSEFVTSQVSLRRAVNEIERLKPSEVIAVRNSDLSGLNLSVPITRLDDYEFDLETATKTLLEHFEAATLEGYGCAHLPLAVRAAGAIVSYLNETQKAALSQLTRLSTYAAESFMALDFQTQNNLELFRNSRSGKIEGSLLETIDLTRTPMGGRLLKRWLGQPLLETAKLNQRQDAVEWFVKNTLVRSQAMALMGGIGDLERLINRVRGAIASPRELATLKLSLEAAPKLKALLGSSPIDWLKEAIKPRQDVVELISQAIVEDPPANLDDGGVIKPGLSEELDHLRQIATSSRQFLADLERRERERTGIKTLRVGYNRVFGYYIEISKGSASQAPADYIRKQTLTNGERFYTPELKEYETQILDARERITELESELFRRICQQVAAQAEPILALADAVAQVDVFSSLAEVAIRHNYVRPELSESKIITIKDGRHPVVERTLNDGLFVPNDCYLSNDDSQLIILTGPNMSGKSTYLRQVALIVLLAQVGSFVPATSASIGLVDRIFTRIGAGEDLAAGKSTFMVEMVETASILNNATSDSLIILDEIGRGTSTYDGLSIARAVCEYIHNFPKLGAKTLFATHYHELVELATYLPRVKNFNVAVTEQGGEVVFLRKIVPGGVDKSYGIHVAKLAGLPRSVVHRAQEVLEEMEEGSRKAPFMPVRHRKAEAAIEQIPMFNKKPQVLIDLENLEIDSLTPLEALTKLYELQQKTKQT